MVTSFYNGKESQLSAGGFLVFFHFLHIKHILQVWIICLLEVWISALLPTEGRKKKCFAKGNLCWAYPYEKQLYLHCYVLHLNYYQSREGHFFFLLVIMFTLIYTQPFTDFLAYQIPLRESFLSQVAYLCVHFTMDWCLKRFPCHSVYELLLWAPWRAFNM